MLSYLQVEMEQALLQAEKRAEQEQVEAENEIMAQLQLKLSQLDKTTQKEKDKVGGSKTNQGQCTLKKLCLICKLNDECIKKPSSLWNALSNDLDNSFISSLS